MRTRAFIYSSIIVLSALSCSPGLTTDAAASGGSGGVPSSGGLAPVGSGGGAPSATGGASATGGVASGGAGPAGSGGVAAGGSGAGGSPAGGSGGEVSTPEFVYDYATTVENTGTDCAIPTLAEPGALSSIEKLPDPFTKLDGTRMTKKSDWKCRRQEIRAQAEKYIYGEKPTPDFVSGTVTGGMVSVQVEDEGTSMNFTATVVLPDQGEGPYPAIINVGAAGGFGGISLGEERILGQGVAIIYFNHTEIGAEGQAEASRGKPNTGKFYEMYGGDHSAGLLMAWAWGASRLIDVLQMAGGDFIDVRRLGVTGCSRNGKGAFAIGVFDERIALTIPHETSTAGVPVYRMVDILGQERTDHNYHGLNWLSDNFAPFVYSGSTSNAVKLPIDAHELVAMIAPRGILVLDNAAYPRMNPSAGHLATAAGAEVFSALGVLGNVSYHSAVASADHCTYKNEYTALLTANIAKFLKHESEAPGEFLVGQNGDGNLAEWKTWETPALK